MRGTPDWRRWPQSGGRRFRRCHCAVAARRCHRHEERDAADANGFRLCPAHAKFVPCDPCGAKKKTRVKTVTAVDAEHRSDSQLSLFKGGAQGEQGTEPGAVDGGVLNPAPWHSEPGALAGACCILPRGGRQRAHGRGEGRRRLASRAHSRLRACVRRRQAEWGCAISVSMESRRALRRDQPLRAAPGASARTASVASPEMLQRSTVGAQAE